MVDKVGYEVVSLVLKKREGRRGACDLLVSPEDAYGKLMFDRDKSTFGALAVPGTYPCGPS